MSPLPQLTSTSPLDRYRWAKTHVIAQMSQGGDAAFLIDTRDGVAAQIEPCRSTGAIIGAGCCENLQTPLGRLVLGTKQQVQVHTG